MAEPIIWIWLVTFVEAWRHGSYGCPPSVGDAWHTAGVVARTCREIRRGQ